MRKSIPCACVMTAMIACSAPVADMQSTDILAFGSVSNGQSLSMPLASAAFAVPAIIPMSETLPSFKVKTAAYKRTGLPASLRKAAWEAADAASTRPKVLEARVGEMMVGFRQIRVDGHDFIVANRTDTRWRAGAQPNANALLATVRSLGDCAVGQDMFPITGPDRMTYFVYALDC